MSRNVKPKAEFSVSEWLDYFETRHKTPIQMGLSRVQLVAKKLNLLAWDIPVITVAGTNGKGSTVASLEAIYTAAGYKVAAYTSPHLVHFNERIKYNNKKISNKALTEIFLRLHATKGSDALTYFEITTLAALYYFKQQKPDVLLLEVGMGGRLDATNCIDATLSIITSIDLDHEAWLGDTTEAIAFEKAGIFRPQQLSVCAISQPPQSLLDEASKKALALSLFKASYDYKIEANRFKFFTNKALYAELPVPKINAKAFASAMMASIKLQAKLPVHHHAYEIAALSVAIPARQQWLTGTRTPTLIDIAHNPESVRLLADYLKAHPKTGQIHAVFSGLQDKSLSGLIEPMQPYVDVWYLTCINSPRGATEVALKQACHGALNQTPQMVFNHPNMAYNAAMSAAKPDDIIVVYGSFLLISAIFFAHLSQGEQHEFSN